jgi:hypothetical protein
MTHGGNAGEDKMITLSIKRANGAIETVDVSSKFGGMPMPLLQSIKTQTAAAGRGEVLSATITQVKCNASELAYEYNRINNEGADGYVPESWSNHPSYREWTETTTINA